MYFLQDNRIEINFEFSRALVLQGNMAKMTCKFHKDNYLAQVLNVLQSDKHSALHVYPGTRVLASSPCLSAILPL